MQCLFVYIMVFYNQCFTKCIFMRTVDKMVIRKKIIKIIFTLKIPIQQYLYIKLVELPVYIYIFLLCNRFL